MTSLLHALALLTLAAFPAPRVASEDPGWITDYDKGLALAVEKQKDLLVEFTGSDWCPPCKALYRDVFSKPEFASALAADFVLVKLDFPNSEELRAKVPNPARNEALMGEFAIKGYPTVLLMTHGGDVYGRSSGYSNEGLEGYIEFVRMQRRTGRARLGEITDLVKRFSAAPAGEGRAALVEEAHGLQAKLGDSPLVERLTPILRAGIELDPKDQRGHRSRGLRILLTSGLATDAEAASAAELDAKNALGLLELVVQRQVKTAGDKESAEAALARLDALLELGVRSWDERNKELLATAVHHSVRVLEQRSRGEDYAALLRERYPNDAQVESFLAGILGK